MTVKSLFARAMTLAAAVIAVVGVPVTTHAQDAAKPAVLATIPVKVDVTLSRYQGDKKISSLPFSLFANAAPGNSRQVQMRMGIEVPAGLRTITSGTDTKTTEMQYRSVGTNIDCSVTRLDDTHFSVFVNVNDSSIYSADGDAKNMKTVDPVAIRTFLASNTVILRDGQTLLFGSGTDKIRGETLQVEVTLTPVK